MNLSLLAISYLIHLIATVVWVGGMMLLVLVIYPLQRRDPALTPFIDAIEARFRPIANFSLLVLLMTGVMQMGDDEHYGGWFNFENGWSQAILGKHLAFLGMMGIVVFLQFALEPALQRLHLLATKSESANAQVEQLRQRRRRLIYINFWLGLAVLFFTAVATAY